MGVVRSTSGRTALMGAEAGLAMALLRPGQRPCYGTDLETTNIAVECLITIGGELYPTVGV